MKRLSVLFMLVLIIAFAMPAFAGNGNQLPSGAHYNLNIIGVENPKTADMTGSDRHTIFVALGKNGTAQSSIWLVPATSSDNNFQVCDGNGFDPAYDCNGTMIKPLGAVFMLPCNTLYGDVVESCADAGVYGTSYSVYVRELGKPGGKASMDLCAYDPSTDTTYCNSDNNLDVQLSRDTGKPKTQNVTNNLTYLWVDVNGDGKLERVALFTNDYVDWVWQYYNNGLKLAQLRFYLE